MGGDGVGGPPAESPLRSKEAVQLPAALQFGDRIPQRHGEPFAPGVGNADVERPRVARRADALYAVADVGAVDEYAPRLHEHASIRKPRALKAEDHRSLRVSFVRLRRHESVRKIAEAIVADFRRIRN